MDRVTTSWSKQWGGRNCQLLCEIFWMDRICVDKQMFVNAEIVYLRRFKSGIQWKIEGGSSQLNKQRLRFRRTSFVTLDVTWCRRNLFLFVAGPRQLFHLSRSSWIRVLVPLLFANVEEIVSNGQCCAMYDDDRWNRFPLKLYIILFSRRYINPWRNKQNVVRWY